MSGREQAASTGLTFAALGILLALFTDYDAAAALCLLIAAGCALLPNLDTLAGWLRDRRP